MGKKGSSFLLEFGFRSHGSEGLSWLCCCLEVLPDAYMAVTLGLFVLLLFSLAIMISVYILVAGMCFILLSGLLKTWVFFCQSGIFKGIFECILL